MAADRSQALFHATRRIATKLSVQRHRSRKISELAATLLPESTVVDIGAAAYPHEQWHSFLHSEKVTWLLVEPDTNALGYTDSWKYRSSFIKEHRGVAEESGQRDLFVTNVPTGSSLLEPSIQESLRLKIGEEGLKYFFPYASESIGCVSLQDLLVEHERTGPIVVKLDTQGSELAILQGAVNLLKSKQLVAISTEISLLSQPAYKDSGTFEDFQRLMLAEGYELVDLNPIWVPSNANLRISRGYLNECDAVYMPRLDLLLSLDLNTQLTACGILIDLGIYGMAEVILSSVIGSLPSSTSDAAAKLLARIRN